MIPAVTRLLLRRPNAGVLLFLPTLILLISPALTALVFGSPAAPAERAGARHPTDVTVIAGRILGQELADGGAWSKLEDLTDRIGPRLSGSPGAAAAVRWALAEFERDGLANVRAEKVLVPHWVRGEETGECVTPARRNLVLTALGMSVPTPEGGVEGEVIEADSLEALRALGDQVRGKIVLMNRETVAGSEMEGYAVTSPLRVRGPSEAGRLGATAFLIRSLGTLKARLPHTGTLVYAEDAPRIPAAALAEEDALVLHRFLAAGDTVRVRLNLGCRTLPDAESANVVAELRGRDRPDEIVVLGAHLDSWDLGDGAIDDGAGVAIVMEAVRLLKQLGLAPRRTLRVVLYMNEENGNRGGKTYAETHHDELSRHVAAIESDSGGAVPLGFRVVAGPGGVEVVSALAEPLALIGAGRVSGGDYAGVDIEPMRSAGVPLVGLRQDTTHYFDWHHTAADTLDKIEPRALAENAAAMAFMAWSLAERDQPLRRVPPETPPEPR